MTSYDLESQEMKYRCRNQCSNKQNLTEMYVFPYNEVSKIKQIPKNVVVNL